MQVDGTGWHKSKDLPISSNLGLLYQLPYFTGIKPYRTYLGWNLRKRILLINSLNSIKNVIDKLSDALMLLFNDKGKVKSTRNFPLYNCIY